MRCRECQQEMTGFFEGYATKPEWTTLGLTEFCSERCAILYYIATIVALDKSALLPLLVTGDRADDYFRLLFRLQNTVADLTASAASPDTKPSS
jgi:hypothetical protein